MKGKMIIELDPDKVRIGERFRKEISQADIDRLAESIRAFGQLQPIGVYLNTDGTYQLVFGHRRLLACKKLGIPVKAVVLGQNPEFSLQLNSKLIEFVENSVRQDFTPTERAEAVLQLHETLKEKDPDWTVEKTARLLGLTRTYVQDLLRIGRAVRKGVIQRDDTRNLRELKASLSTLSQVEQIRESVIKAEAEAEIKIQGVEDYKVLNSDCFEIAKQFQHEFHLVLTDPPYGIDYINSSDMSKDHHHFDDDPVKFWSPKWIDQLLDLFNTLLHKTEGIAFCFCSIEQFIALRSRAKAHGFGYVYPKPFIWIKQAAGVPYTKYSPTSCYEVGVFMKRSAETPTLKLAFPDWVNISRLPPGKRLHPTEKPIELWRYLLEQISLPHFRVVDPFCGSGSSLLACLYHGIPFALGIEIEKDFAELAQQRLAEAKLSLASSLVIGQTESAQGGDES